MPTKRVIGSSGMKLGFWKLELQQQVQEIKGIVTYGVLN
jgi:hypothetical protein